MRIVSELLLSILYIFPIEVKTNILGSEHTMPFVSSSCVPADAFYFFVAVFVLSLWRNVILQHQQSSSFHNALCSSTFSTFSSFSKIKRENWLTENQTKQLANKSWKWDLCLFPNKSQKFNFIWRWDGFACSYKVFVVIGCLLHRGSK